MLGYDMSWASFHIVEVMSSPKLLHKRAGYLAATQSFQQDTDVLMLTTNLIKKDLASSSPLEIGIAVNGLSHIVTADLARDLCQDLVAMLNHSRPYIRKKVVLVLYKVFLKFPEALRLSFPRLKEKLEDADPSVVSATVSVVCELARKNPRNYLSLAPQLFRLLTTSANNWMLIKIIKMFASLTPLEPRLIKKLLPPLTSLIQTTPAMSLLYECIHTVITGGFLEAAGDSSHALAATCVNKLRRFLEDPDQNLKYVGLLAMSRLLSTHPKLIAEHKDIILECIDDDDFSIRFRALDLVVGMANKKSLVDIVKRLITHLVPGDSNGTSSLHEASSVLDPVYRTDIINRIVFISSQNQYRNVSNFEWYITVLVGLAHVSGVSVGEILTTQLMDVSVRVKSVRPFAVKQMFRLLSDHQLLRTARKRDTNIEVLSAAAWICGEYCSFLDNIPATLECLLTPYVVDMPVKVQAIYVHNIIKIYAFWVNELIDEWNTELQTEFVKVTEVMKDKISMFTRSADLEVQERACNAQAIFDIVLAAISQDLTSEQAPLVLQGLPALFSLYELNPVAPKAQRKVPVPDDLDLDVWINEPLPDLVDDSESEIASLESPSIDVDTHATTSTKKKKKKSRSKRYDEDDSEDDEDKERRRAARLEALRNDPYYIMSDKSEKQKQQAKLLDLEEDVDSIPIVKLSIDDFDVAGSSGKSKKHRKKSKGKRQARVPSPPPPVYAPEEMPEDAVDSASDQEGANGSSKRRGSGGAYSKSQQQRGKDIFATDDDGLNTVDLNTPLGADERFPEMQTYSSPEELRRREEARARVEKRERRLAQSASTTALKDDGERKKKKKKRKSVDGEVKKPKKSTSGTATKEKKKKKKKAAAAEQEPESVENVQSNEVPDMPTEELLKDQLKQIPPELLLSNENIELHYLLSLSDEKDNGTSVVEARLNMKNKTTDATLTNLHFTTIESFDFRYVEHMRHPDLASLSDTFELEAGKDIEAAGYFAVTGDIRRGLCLRCDMQYDIQDSSALNQIPLEMIVRPSVFLIQDQAMDPTEFANLLAEHGQEFDYRDTVTIEIPIATDAAVDQKLIDALSTITSTTRLQVVEVVPGAASLYAKSIQGSQIAGLLKYDLTSQEGNATITIDLKCTDDGFLEAFVDQLKAIQL
ncbi:adaptin N terminal region-domain-containing protein [Zychaea mexicana]|uniref:adaptin N terminal region-domain-containing protein n=1 Tax=Zychaea mexicana TaxID=64656 RepID=UPI0022FF0C04|nr:adaptin N terminal region-domain-containing protein [Zychaea mexicana]KAI9497642.1 adaptin N terminal region-domain-containing protein [Zychaea mexicana]